MLYFYCYVNAKLVLKYLIEYDSNHDQSNVFSIKLHHPKTMKKTSSSFIFLSTAVDNKMIIKLEYDINHIKYI